MSLEDIARFEEMRNEAIALDKWCDKLSQRIDGIGERVEALEEWRRNVDQAANTAMLRATGPGEVLDAFDLDAKLVEVRTRGEWIQRARKAEARVTELEGAWPPAPKPSPSIVELQGRCHRAEKRAELAEASLRQIEDRLNLYRNVAADDAAEEPF